MIERSSHAEGAMESDGISEEEVRHCLENGELEIRQVVGGETRYGKQLELKDKKIMVIYSLLRDVQRVITAYTIQRKRTWQRKN